MDFNIDKFIDYSNFSPKAKSGNTPKFPDTKDLEFPDHLNEAELQPTSGSPLPEVTSSFDTSLHSPIYSDNKLNNPQPKQKPFRISNC